jgi:hypothetical protein
MNRFVSSTALTVSLSYILTNIQNRSNFRKEYVIPLISLLMTKYIIGDFDTGYTWTFNDIIFVSYVLLLSYAVVRFSK